MAVQLFPRPLCVVDVETWHPGGRGERHRLVEIGAVMVDVYGYPGAVHHRLCRPSDLPRSTTRLLGNSVPVAALWEREVPSEHEAAREFAEWHFARSSPELIAYNSPFDRAALGGALVEADGCGHAPITTTWPLPWGPCLMATAKRLLGRQQSKELAAAEAIPDPHRALEWVARRVRYAGELDMHRALPDALLEAALLVALRRRELAAAPSSPSLPAPASGRPSLFGALA